MSTLYTTGDDVDRVRQAVAELIGEPRGYNVEAATEYPGYSIAIDLARIYDADYVASILESVLGRSVVTESAAESQPSVA